MYCSISVVSFLALFPILACETSWPKSVNEILHSHLSSFELLEPLRLISRRGTDKGSTQYLNFKAFRREFHLVLESSRTHSAQTNSINITVMRGDGSQQVTDFQASDILMDFLEGRISGERESYVSGYTHEGSLHITIYEGNSEVLNIEPISLLTGNLSDKRLVAFFDSNITYSKYCGLNFEEKPIADPNPRLVQRRKRHSRMLAGPISDLKYTCPLQLVADHLFVRHVGSAQLAIKYIIKAIDDVNKVFLSTEFPAINKTIKGVGLTIIGIAAMVNPTDATENGPMHFNAPPIPLPLVPRSLLDAFGDEGQHGIPLSNENICLSHLLTSRRMTDSILGVAYPGSKNDNQPTGGVCSRKVKSVERDSRWIAKNIGITTLLTTEGETVLSRQTSLVIAHEIAHNFGSLHDPQTPECSPGLKNGGSYLMSAKAVSGLLKNNFRMSPCSRGVIGEIVKSRIPKCLRPSRRIDICGNFHQDPGEQCDAGPLGDDCCDMSCRLRSSANCSDFNAACCSNCQLMKAESLCRKSGPPLRPCQMDAYCDGRSPTCPKFGAPLKDGTACLSGIGMCYNGSCSTFCEFNGMKPCRCPNIEDACRLCCSGGANRIACTLYSVTKDTKLQTNAGWIQPEIGAGDQDARWPGCDKEAKPGLFGGLTRRLFRLAVEADSSVIVAGMRDNMVFIVITLSLLIWAPVCTVIDHSWNRRIRISQVTSNNNLLTTAA